MVYIAPDYHHRAAWVRRRSNSWRRTEWTVAVPAFAHVPFRELFLDGPRLPRLSGPAAAALSLLTIVSTLGGNKLFSNRITASRRTFGKGPIPIERDLHLGMPHLLGDVLDVLPVVDEE